MKGILTRILGGEITIKLFGPASRNLPLLILFGILLVAGCSKVGKFLPSNGGSGSSGNQSPDTSRPASPTAERQLLLNQPRVFNYAHVQFTVTKAMISGRVEEELPIDNSKPDIADITFSVVNTLKDGVRIESGLWQLRLGDGSVYKQVYSDVFQPRDTKERKVSFRVPSNSQWAGAQIVLDEQDKEPATLKLDGDATPPQYPATIATAGGETTTKDPTIAYSIIKATVDEDAFGKRAVLGKRYLNLTVHAADKGLGGLGGYFLPEYFRLIIDGQPTAPETASDSKFDSGSSQDYTMSYIVPKNLSMVELEVGKPDQQETKKIHIDLEKVSQ